MFNALKPLLESCTALSVTLSMTEDETLTVTVIPKPKATGDLAKGLSTPLQLVGTADELETQFAGLLSTYTDKYKSLVEQVAATTSVLEEAKKTVSKAGAKAAAKSPATTDLVGKGSDGADGESGSDNAGGSGTPSGPVTADNLFDEE